MQRKLIEYDLPLSEVSEASSSERSVSHGHPSSLHRWWARRPLAASRATAFAALVDDPGPDSGSERQQLRELVADMSPWAAVKDGDTDPIHKARRIIRSQFGEEPPTVLDPFAGGGSIPLEAARLGCRTYCSDYNPLAVFIEKATIQWPQQFGYELAHNVATPQSTDLFGADGTEKQDNLLAYLVERWANKILEGAKRELEKYYPAGSATRLVGEREIEHANGWTPVGYIWVRRIPCQNPSCSFEVPLNRHYWLAKKKNRKRIAYRPVIDQSLESISFEVLGNDSLNIAQEAGFDPNDGTVSNADAECLVCGQVTDAEVVRRLAREGQMSEQMVAAVMHHPEEVGKKYRSLEEQDFAAFEAAREHLQDLVEAWPYLESPLPEEDLPPVGTLGFRVNRYGITKWKDLFNDRQLLSLLTLSRAIRDSYKDIESECENLVADSSSPISEVSPSALAGAVQGYLGLILDGVLDRCSTVTPWNHAGEKIDSMFPQHALRMRWDFAELNPFSGINGDWTANTDWVLRFLRANHVPQDVPARAKVDSATNLSLRDSSVDAVLTDPPYYDNVPYATLSDYFYVWLKRSVGESFPDIFATPLVPKSDEAIMEPVRHDTRKQARDFFEQLLASSFKEIRRVLKPGGIAVIVYAYKTTEGWENMLNALVDSGLIVTGSWPLQTERKARPRASQSAALASSIYMVCRNGERESRGWWEEVRRDVKSRVNTKLEQLWEEDLIRGGDFFIAAIGPGMEGFSLYDRVETYEGKRVGVLDLLQFIRSVATEFLVHRLLRDASAEAIDKISQFYLTYRWTYGDNRVEYDDARRIATAEGVRLDAISGEGGLVRQATKYVSVLGPKERNPIKAEKVGCIADAVHRACQLWEQGEFDELDRWLTETGYAGSNAFWQYCQAVAECLNNGNKEKQLLEQFLVRKDRYRPGGTPTKEQTEMEFED